MESLDKTILSPEKPTEAFNFPEIAAIKENMVALCRKMKEPLDEGKYTALVSDEVGGRIPTLIFRKIIKTLHPEKELKTLFVASGQKSRLPDYENQKDKDNYAKLVEYLSRAVKPEDYVLLVTQFIYSGQTIQKLSVAIGDAGQTLEGLDVAATNAFHISEKELKKGVITSEDEDDMFRSGGFPHEYRRPILAKNIFIGATGVMSTDEMEKKHNRLTGVSKEREYNPSPMLYTKHIGKYGKNHDFLSQEQWDELFGVEEGDSSDIKFHKRWEDPENKKKYEEVIKKPLSDEERKEIQEQINKTREDVDTLAKIILKEVWGK